jgi:uncharacterized protein YycO
MDAPKILLFKGQGAVSKLIRWQTNGDYSHAAIQRPDGRIIEAWHKPAKVRLRGPLQSWANVEAFEVEGMDAAQWAEAIAWAEKQIGKKYDFGGVLRFLTRWRKKQDDKWFCSELVFQAVKEGGVDLLHRIQGAQVSPTVLSFSPLLKPSEPYR